LDVRVTGTMADALAGEPLSLAACDGATLALDGGDHDIVTTRGHSTGLEIDRLVLRSEAGGAASPAGSGTLAGASAGRDEPAAGPNVAVVDDDHDHTRVQISGATPDEPFWLVMGQSHNPGWTATVD